MEYRFDFDDQLPDLPIAFDLDEVAEVFAHKLFGADPSQDLGGTSLVRKLQDVKYRPSNRCVTTYDLILGNADGAPLKTIGVLEFTPDGVLPRLYTDDERLPWLSNATDIEEMQRRFSELPAFTGHGKEVRLWEISPIRYKPGLHCVIRYTV